jgi:proteasome lid subunit RPN8/RPN11
MNDESSVWRLPPQIPYRGTGKIARAGEAALTATLGILQSVGHREAACLWLGRILDSGESVVEAVVAPKQTNRLGNYSIDPAAMQEVAKIARPNKWTLVAAIHSHPGSSVEHSRYDDEMTPSRSAISIVFSHYGRGRGELMTHAGVHEFVDDYWHLLPPIDAQKRIVFQPDLPCLLYDLR